MPVRAAALPEPALADLDLTAVLKALSDPVRVGVVLALADLFEPIQCSRILLPVGKATAAHHFRVLREAGLVRQVPEGTRLLNSLRRSELDHRFPGLIDLVLREAKAAPVSVEV